MAATERAWAELSADEKMDRRFDAWLNPPFPPFAGPEAEEAYRTRVARLTASLRMQDTPDRVPFPMGFVELYPALRKGLTPYDTMHDFDRAAEAWVDFHDDFQPDGMVSPLVATLPSKAFELVDYKLYSWPGHGVPKEAGYQYNEAEWMLAEEYDYFISDPTDFLLRRYLPRIAGAFEGFSKLGSLLDPGVMAFSPGFFASWAQPEILEGLERIVAAGKEMGAWFGNLVGLIGRLQAAGYPPLFMAATEAPFDYLGDQLRGTKEVLMDMYRRPEQLLAACDRLVPLMVRWVTEKTNPGTLPLVFIPLHKGADGFMSLEQFETFYWPSLRAVMLGLIEEGFMPLPFAEGRYSSRLETISDLPKGKTVWLFDQTDMGRVKETVGRVAAIQGNVPLSLLHAGTPDEVREYCRKLIEVAAPGGGFLLDIGAVMHQGKDENLRAMQQAAVDFGKY